MKNETEGWNYDNLRPEGRNIYIFRDTNHISPLIQWRLAEALNGAISQGRFNLLFTEGLDRNYCLFPESLDSIQCPNMVSSNKKSYSDAIPAVIRQLKKEGSLETRIHGVDSAELRLKQINCAKKLAEIYEKMQVRKDTLLDSVIGLIESVKSGLISRKRTIYSVNSILRFMEDYKAQTAGIVYGDDHCKLLAHEFKKLGFGYATFYPGDVDTSINSIVEYVGNLDK